MNRHIYSIVLLLNVIAWKADAQVVTIPDANFKAALVSNFAINTNHDGEIQYSEASAFTGYLDLWNKNISDLTGIEAFTGITDMNVSQNHLTSLDLTHNYALKGLSCYFNSLTSLNVGNCLALQVLVCGSNSLFTLDVSSNPDLFYLDCSSTELYVLDLSSNSALTYLDCSYNNWLTTLNLKNGNNHIMPNEGLENGLNVGFHADNNDLLTCIQVDDPAYSTLTWQHKDAKAGFSTDCAFEKTQVVTIPDVNFKAALLSNPDINTNQDTSIQRLEASIFGGFLDVNTQNISDLTGIEAFTNLTGLNVSQNHLTTLDLSHNSKLTGVACVDNNLTSLDVSQCFPLEVLHCAGNNLQSLDVYSKVYLKRLWCSANPLTSLDLSSNSALTYFECTSDIHLKSVNLKNGNNHNMPNGDIGDEYLLGFWVYGNDSLTCIEVDDPAYSSATWKHKDAGSKFSTDCSSAGCAATFSLTADPNELHHYIATNTASGAAPLQYDWSWGDGSDDDHTAYPSHTYASAGFYNICLTITDQSGCSSSSCSNDFQILRSTNSILYITVVPSILTAIEDIHPPAATFTLHPNPAENELRIKDAELSMQGAAVRITNTLGQTILQISIINLQSPIDVSRLSPGLYFLTLSNDKEVRTGRFVKE